jgi:uncharacterized membrane protein
LRVRRLPDAALSDRPLLAVFALALVANLALYLYLWRVTPSLPEVMPLHYDALGVVDQLGRPAELFRLPMIGSVVLLVDAVLSAFLQERERPAAHVLVWAALGVQLVLASGAWLVISRA